MTHILHVQFNSEFNKELVTPNIQAAIIDAVASCSGDIIRSKFANVRCPDLVNDKIRRRVNHRGSLYLCSIEKLFINFCWYVVLDDAVDITSNDMQLVWIWMI